MNKQIYRTMAATVVNTALTLGAVSLLHAAQPAAVDDHGNSCAAATVLNGTASIDAAINSGGDWDYFQVTVPVAGELTVGSSGETDTYGVLKSAKCATLKVDDDSGRKQNFALSSIVEAGTYYIAVRHHDGKAGVGPYGLDASFAALTNDDFGNTCAAASPMELNTAVDGVIEKKKDIDYFKIELTGNETINVGTQGTTDTYGYLKDAKCRTIKYDDNFGGGNNFSIAVDLPPGVYYVAVREFGAKLGRYVLSVKTSIPGDVTVDRNNAAFTKSSNKIAVSSANATVIYFTTTMTVDGSTPDDPPVPTMEANNGHVFGPDGVFVVKGDSKVSKKVKVRFRGCNSIGCGLPSDTYVYTVTKK